VMVASADIADEAQVRSVIEQAQARFGMINGVIHAAGIAGGGLIQLKSAEVAAAVLAPKVRGTAILASLLREVPLDFVILCSSLTAVYGGLGQVDYCGANAFLDAFAQSQRPAAWDLMVSINWDSWREVGMAVNTPLPAELEAARQESLRTAITPREGGEIVARILQTHLPRVAVSPLGVATAASEQPPRPAATAQPAAAPTESYARHARPPLATAYVAPRNETEEVIAGLWQQLLGIEPVGVHDTFLELGGHSLLAIQLISQLRERLQLEISIQQFFDAPTVAQLAALVETHIDEDLADTERIAQLLEQIEQLSDDEARALLDGQAALAAHLGQSIGLGRGEQQGDAS